MDVTPTRGVVERTHALIGTQKPLQLRGSLSTGAQFVAMVFVKILIANNTDGNG